MLPLYVLERPQSWKLLGLNPDCLIQIYGQKLIRCKYIFKIVCNCLKISTDNFKLKLWEYGLL